jgi:hypothetical protein
VGDDRYAGPAGRRQTKIAGNLRAHLRAQHATNDQDAQQKVEMAGNESSISDTSFVSQRTSAITLLSSIHGREGRAQRLISKLILQAAVKYGTREVAPPINGRGDYRLKFTFADVVYITDISGAREITSYAIPGAGIDIEMVPIAAKMMEKHINASKNAKSDKSQIFLDIALAVLVVDQSGSMRKPMEGGGHTIRCGVGQSSC